MSVTLQSLIGIIAARCGYYATGIATGGSTTTLLDTNTLIEPDNVWARQYLKMLSGPNAGLERLITAYTQAGGCTFTPAYGSAVAAGNTYEIKGVRDGDVSRAIDGAVRRAESRWMVIKTDETGSFAVGQQVYTLPVDLVSLIAVDVYTSQPTDDSGGWRPFTAYEVFGPPGARKLQLRGWSNVPDIAAATYQYRVRYLALPTVLSGSTSTLGLDDTTERGAIDFVAEYALHLLHEQALARNITGEQARVHLQMSRDHKQKALEAEARAKPRYSGRVLRAARPRQIG